MWLKQLFLLGDWLLWILKAGVGPCCKLVLELLNSPRSVNELQLSSVKRMTDVANVHTNFFTSASRYETATASASNLSLDIFWVNAVFHDLEAIKNWETKKLGKKL